MHFAYRIEGHCHGNVGSATAERKGYGTKSISYAATNSHNDHSAFRYLWKRNLTQLREDTDNTSDWGPPMQKEIKSIAEITAKTIAVVVTILTLVTLVFSTLLDGNDLVAWLFPPAPLEGEWSGKVQGSEVRFCFEQYGSIVWGEFQWATEPHVSVDGTVDGNMFTLEYERIDSEYPDWGIIMLTYSASDRVELLRGYWKSERARSETVDSRRGVWGRNRDALTLKKVRPKCKLSLFPSPGGSSK